VYGGGSNYIGVFAKLDWTVKRGTSEDEDSPKYVEGATPWVLLGKHDSCWRDAVYGVIRDYICHICTIDTLRGWYKVVAVDEPLEETLAEVIRNAPGYGNVTGPRVELEALEFRFE
jgi:hypothetical protein